MGLNRRLLLKMGAITGAGSLILGGRSLARRGRGRGRGRSRRREVEATNDAAGSSMPGANNVVHFSGSNVTYVPFTQDLPTHPNILGFDTNDPDLVVDPADGTVRSTNSDPEGANPLTPYPGTPGLADVGSNEVKHGIAPEYSRQNPTHLIANTNESTAPPPPEGDCQTLTAAYPWDRFDQGDRNVEPWERPNSRNGEAHYAIETVNSTHEWAPGVVTDILAYRDGGGDQRGEFPAPTIVARQGQPTVIRVHNQIKFRPPNRDDQQPTETSVHLHGDHTPCHSDGYPDFYVLPFEKRDYYYPNIGPREEAKPVLEKGLSPIEIAKLGNIGHYSLSDLPTTMWYHEHGMDITGYLVSQGLAGFYLVQDDHEMDLIKQKKLPKFYGKQDIPMALMDQIIDLKQNVLPYDFFDHNGRLGNVFSVNGALQPRHKVGKGKYRFRFLNASNARIYQLALKPENGSRLDWLQIGQDTWELDRAVTRRDFLLAMAERVDVVVDFSKFNDGDVIWLNNIMEQDSGRKPKGIDRRHPTPLVKFVVDESIEVEDFSVKDGDRVRCFTPIKESEVLATRYFTFVRRNGAWQINNQFFSPRTTNSTPILNSAERWVFENKAGGWWHPIHIHLEAHEIQKFNGIPKFRNERDKRAGRFNPKFPAGFVNNVDVSVLEGGGTSEFLMKFRTFTGPFVFHCHNLEHEDMRMMHVFDPRPAGEPSLNDGSRPHSSEFSADGVSTYRQVSGMVRDEEEEPNGFGPVFFDRQGDRELLEDRNVGFPADDFPNPPAGQIKPGAPAADAPDNHDDD